MERGDSHVNIDYRNSATAADMSKEQTPVLFKFPRTLQGKTGWKPLFPMKDKDEARRTLFSAELIIIFL